MLNGKSDSKFIKIIIVSSFLSALVTLLVYLPALNNDFVEWDDQAYVYENPNIRNISVPFFKWVFTSIVNSNWHPLTVISYALDYSIWGLNPFGYHLTNIIFHGLNTFLVFVVTVQLITSKESGISTAEATTHRLFTQYCLLTGFIVSLLFGLHPLHVESVAWVSERKDVLNGFFYLLSVICYLEYAASRKILFYITTLVFFALSLLSKPMTVTFPVVLLILDYYPLERLVFKKRGISKWIFIEKIPFLILGSMAVALTVWAQHHADAITSFDVSPLSERLDVATRGFIFYLKKMALPLNLAPFYVRPLKHEFYDYGFAISLISFLAITLTCIVLMRKKIFSAVWLYYVVMLLPVIGIVQVSDQAAADRYSYLPSIGPFMLAGLAAGYILKKHRRLLPVISAFTVSAMIILTILTLKQISVWKDTVSLWSQEIKIFPTVQAYTKRARAYGHRGDFSEAVKDYTVVIKNSDEYLPGLYFERGTAYLEAADIPDNYIYAINDFSESIRLNPRNAVAYNNRGNAYKNLGNYVNALEDLEKAAELSPENPSIYFNLGLAYFAAGDKGSAILNIKKAAGLGSMEALDYLRVNGFN